MLDPIKYCLALMPQINGKRRKAGNRIRLPGLNGNSSNCESNFAIERKRKPPHCFGHSRNREKAVLPVIHRGCAGMTITAGYIYFVPANTLNARDDADFPTATLEDRSLLNMKFNVSGRLDSVSVHRAGVTDASEFSDEVLAIGASDCRG
ncbi:hypothetical protein AB3X94_37635 [Paraburkholderia sp. BR10923]|uniref:hypothetical protein n=1 Tax=Paraburkholderia sp. BR10923 TaxID=3236992 RepID=UPI0034CD2F97